MSISSTDGFVLRRSRDIQALYSSAGVFLACFPAWWSRSQIDGLLFILTGGQVGDRRAKA